MRLLRVMMVVAEVMGMMLMMSLTMVKGHGRLMEPPSRSSMWRAGFPTPHNYNDNALNCGGLNAEWYVNHGKCGVCGDPYGQPSPRDNEAGGKYGKGIITRTYSPGQTIEVRVEITANHLGFFEFRLCPHNSPTTPVTQQCLDRYLLSLADGSGTRFDLGSRTGFVNLKLKLPLGVTCSQCVLQWKWHAANNRGGNETIQEEFYGCSDIAIGSTAATTPSGPQATTLPPYTPRPTPGYTPPPTRYTPPPTSYPIPVCHAAGTYVGLPEIDRLCSQNCFKGNCPPNFCVCSSFVTPYWTTAPPPYTTAPPPFTYPGTPSQGGTVCHAIGSWKGQPQLDLLCDQNCRSGNCPPLYCSCSAVVGPQGTTAPAPFTTAPPPYTTAPPPYTTAPPPYTTAPPPYTTAPPPVTNNVAFTGVCYGVNAWHGVAHLDQLCTENCRLGNCQPMYCKCSATRPPQMPTSMPPFTTAPVQWTTAPPLVNTRPVVVASMPNSNIGVCYAISSWKGNAQLDQFCNDQCHAGNCPYQYCACGSQPPVTTAPPPVTTAPPPVTTTPPPTSNAQPQTSTFPLTCFGINAFSGSLMLDKWCQDSCSKGQCPQQNCKCVKATAPPVTPPTTVLQGSSCHGINAWFGVPELDRYCREQCPLGNCPPNVCSCVTASATPQAHTTPVPRSVTPPVPRTTPGMPTPSSLDPSKHCFATGNWLGDPDKDRWCDVNCPLGLCLQYNCHCGSLPSTPIPGMALSPTFQPSSSSVSSAFTGKVQLQCRAINGWAGQTQLDDWCMKTCQYLPCDPQYCLCQNVTVAPPTLPPTTPTAPTLPAIGCYAINTWAGNPKLDDFCDKACSTPSTGLCNSQYCLCGPRSQLSKTTLPPFITVCSAINAWAGNPKLDQFCDNACRVPSNAMCNVNYCQCTHQLNPSLSTSATSGVALTPKTTAASSPQSQCRSLWPGVPDMDRWCQLECVQGNCPPSYCQCGP